MVYTPAEFKTAIVKHPRCYVDLPYSQRLLELCCNTLRLHTGRRKFKQLNNNSVDSFQMFLDKFKRLTKLLIRGRIRPRIHPLIEVRGKHSYGIENINLITFSNKSRLGIGSFCSIAGNVTVLLGGDHRTDWATTYPFGHINQDKFNGSVYGLSGHPLNKGDVIVEHDAWIGYGVTILSGVTLGAGCCIGAGSVVSKRIPPYAIAAGNPAKVIRLRFDQEVIEILQRIAWWNLPDHIINIITPILQQPCSMSLARRLESICSIENPENPLT